MKPTTLIRATVLCVSAVLAGCSAMSQKECQQADWSLMGEVDASQGRAFAAIDTYRKECAEHDIRPDSQAYQAGFERGLERFCSRSNGFYFGKRGGQYKGTCSNHHEQDFLAGYEPGFELFMIQDRITKLNMGVQSDEQEVRQLQEEIDEREARLIKEELTPGERAVLLKEIKARHGQIFHLKQDLRDRRLKLLQMQQDLRKKTQLVER